MALLLLIGPLGSFIQWSLEHDGSKPSTSTVSLTAAKGNCFHFFLFPLTESSLFCRERDKTSCLVSLCKAFTENALFLCCNVAGSTCFSFHIFLLIIITLVMKPSADLLVSSFSCSSHVGAQTVMEKTGRCIGNLCPWFSAHIHSSNFRVYNTSPKKKFIEISCIRLLISQKTQINSSWVVAVTFQDTLGYLKNKNFNYDRFHENWN